MALGPKLGPPGLPKDLRGPQKGLSGGPRSAVVVSYGARAHDMDAAHPVEPTSGTWAKIRPTGAARGPPGHQKGLSGPKWALLGAPGVPYWSLEGPEHMVWMRPTQLDRRVRKSKNFPGSKICHAKTFRIKRVNCKIFDMATNVCKTRQFLVF